MDWRASKPASWRPQNSLNVSVCFRCAKKKDITAPVFCFVFLQRPLLPLFLPPPPWLFSAPTGVRWELSPNLGNTDLYRQISKERELEANGALEPTTEGEQLNSGPEVKEDGAHKKTDRTPVVRVTDGLNDSQENRRTDGRTYQLIKKRKTGRHVRV